MTHLVDYLVDKNIDLQFPACNALGYIICGSDISMQFMLEIQLLGILEYNLQSTNPVIVKLTCWSLSNLFEGSLESIIMILQNKKIMKEIVKCVGHNDILVAEEAS